MTDETSLDKCLSFKKSPSSMSNSNFKNLILFNSSSEIRLSFKEILINRKTSFKAKGLNFNIGDRFGARMTYTQAIKEAKRQNIGHSVGGTKMVEVKPFVKFQSSWQIQLRNSFLSALDKERA